MKKALLMISSLMLILLAGCCRDEEAIEKIPYGPIRFYGNVVDAFLTKATDNYFVIQDSIGIFMIKSGSQLSSTTILDGVNNYHYEALSTSATPEFVPTSPADTIYYPTPAIPAFIAYYPAKDTVDSNFLLPIDLTGQATVANIPPLDLLYSNNATDQTSNVVSLVFNHMLSYITFTISAGTGLQPADLDGMSVTFNNVSTTADFSLVDGAFQNLGPLTSSIRVPGKYYSTSEDGYFECLFLPNGSGNSSTIEFLLADNKKFTYTIPATQQYLTGHIYNYKITLSATAASISGSVITWAPGSLPNEGVITVN